MNINKEFVSLISLKLDILKLKSDHYDWGHIDKKDQESLLDCLAEIEMELSKLRKTK